jgi:hypothetical protein
MLNIQQRLRILALLRSYRYILRLIILIAVPRCIQVTCLLIKLTSHCELLINYLMKCHIPAHVWKVTDQIEQTCECHEIPIDVF